MPHSVAQRQRDYRSRGKPLSLTLRDPEAIRALDKLAKIHGSQRAAIEAALIAANRSGQNHHLR